jgi:uncharacterized protein (DUF697 family)
MHKTADHQLPKRLAEIVKLHAGLAVGSAFIPVPGADLAATVANIWAMYARINHELGLKVSENVIKTVAGGVATNLAGAAAGLLVVGAAVKLFPGMGSLGGAALMAATVFGITIASGIIYMRVIAALHEANRSGSFTEEDFKRAAEVFTRDKDALKDMIKEGRKDYTPR